ncbi:MAG: polysaccharide biosynthesis/export family protein [Acidobacteria bacterium]|nr:polysaccharide biosynthesis/export family protein [Acidobacteriota bacterium]
MRFPSRFSIVFLLVFAGLASAQKPQKKDQEVSEAKKGVEVPATSLGTAVDPKTYKIGAEDVVNIRVWREAELSGPIMVRPDGKITMPLIGELKAEGMTPDELGKAITEALKDKLTRPEVFIQVQQVNSKKYYITGEVNRTGSFPLVTPITVFEALSIAGGLREYANQKNIVIVRGNDRLKFNYKEVVDGKNLKQNILLQTGDHIIVR